MRAAKLLEPNRPIFTGAPEPVIGADDVLIKVHSAGICGTDIHILKGEYEAHYPLIPGHEFSGEVAAVGSNVTRYRVGDRVTADPNVPCNRCYFCQRNEPNQCRNLRAIGVTGDGAFAEYVSAPEGNVFPIGDMPYASAALIEPLACVVWGLKQVEIQPGDSVVIFGAGPMGCLLVQAVKCAGAARIAVVDLEAWRLDLAASLGATETLVAGASLAKQLQTLEPYGFDVAADATGVPSVIEDMFAYAKPRGKVWVFGVAPVGARVGFVPYDVFRKDLKVIGSFAVNRTFPQSIALIQSGAVRVEPLISHHLPLEAFAEGLELAQRDPRRMKVQFDIA
ncbi:MAG: zinc-dependent alcohol dehydrogenase family protein [Anaerolineae bacterium]|nr:zinc-dependent alcohol dehydrogenase family protein [Anaerolineae bacterium]